MALILPPSELGLKDVYNKNHNYLKSVNYYINIHHRDDSYRNFTKILRFTKGRHACLICGFSILTCPDKLVWRARDCQLFHCNSFDSPAVRNLPFVPLFIPYRAKPATNISTSPNVAMRFFQRHWVRIKALTCSLCFETRARTSFN